MEPQCQPKTGPARAEHQFDEDGICERCGFVSGSRVPPAATPRPAPRPIVAPAADGLRRQAGGVSKPGRDARIAFGQMAGTTPRPRADAPSSGNGHEPQAHDIACPCPDCERERPQSADVATIPDPLGAAIAELELERSEIEVAIETLGRLRARKDQRGKTA
jgi:hypothetical protein